MAYQDNNKEVEIASLQKNSRGDYILIKQVENTKTGAIAVDVREYYTNDDDELAPTKKGIRIKDEQAAEVIVAMFKACTTEAQMDILDAINSMEDDSDAVDSDAVDSDAVDSDAVDSDADETLLMLKMQRKMSGT